MGSRQRIPGRGEYRQTAQEGLEVFKISILDSVRLSQILLKLRYVADITTLKIPLPSHLSALWKTRSERVSSTIFSLAISP
jgi:hypothetical protein